MSLCCVLVHDSQVVLEKTTKGADLLILSFLSGLEQERYRRLVLFCTLRPMVLESSKAQIKDGNCLVLWSCFTEKALLLGSARQARKFKEAKSGEFFAPLLWNWRRTRKRWKGKRLIVETKNWRRWVNLVTSFFIFIFLTLLSYTGLKPIYWLKLLKSTEMAETNWGNLVIGLVFFEGVICTGLVTGTIIFGCTD